MRVARNVVRDIGSEAAASSGGLVQLARWGEHNAERDTHNVLVKQLRLSIPIPLRKLGKGRLNYTVLRLRDWMGYLLQHGLWYVLCGLIRPDAARQERILLQFWNEFQKSHPRHPVYELARSGSLCLARTAPLVYHGDEGRGCRRSAWLVTSYHSLIGRGIRPGDKNHTRKYVKLRPNFVGHSFTTRFLQASMPKASYEDDVVFQALLSQCVEESRYMSSEGILHAPTNKRYHAIILNVVGDWQWLVKAGNLRRSYTHAVKHGTPPANPIGICHKCLAGTQGHDFEAAGSRTPSWLGTMGQGNPFAEPKSPLCQLMHAGCEADIFAWDLWHAYHLGVGRAFVGSTLALLSATFDGASKDRRFAQLTSHFLRWCRSTNRSPTLKRITKETIGWEVDSNFPAATWYKGSMTTIMTEYVEYATSNLDFEDDLLNKAGEAAQAMNTFLRGLYSNDLFLSADLAKTLGEQGLRFLRRYSYLAKAAHDQGRTLYVLLPKLHILQHLCLVDLLKASETSSSILNPVCQSVQMDEDYIGRNSRLARHVHPAKSVERCVQRHLQQAYEKYVAAGLIVRDATD